MERPYVDPREQIARELEGLGYELSMEYPSGEVILPRITYSLITNSYLTDATDRIHMQVDAWANTFEEVLHMVEQINQIMTELNGRRTYESPDTRARENVDLYHKALDYEFTADIIFKRFL